MSSDIRLIYVADPMCSWCYGFAPELERTLADTPAECRIVMGGLRIGTHAQPLTPDLKRYLEHAWSNVGSKSGQPFAFDLLDWDESWIYDTEPSCRAVVTMRTLAPGMEHRFFGTLQHAFYAENRDLTDEFIYPRLLNSYPVDVEDFMTMFRSREILEATRADFAAARELGVTGFPTLLLQQHDTTYTPLTRGFKRADALKRTLAILAD